MISIWRSRSGSSIAWRGVASSIIASRLIGVTVAAALMRRMIACASSSTSALTHGGAFLVLELVLRQPAA